MDWKAKISFDENAIRTYDLMRGGFVWSDELPSCDEPTALSQAIEYLAWAIAYRASLSLGRPNEEFEPDWKRVLNEFPQWPGFRRERIYGQVERDLRAVKIREDRCIRRIEAELDED